MKKIITIVLCVLLCIGAMGGTFALAKKLDSKPTVEQSENHGNGNSSTEDTGGTDETDETPSPPETVAVWRLCTSVDDLSVGDQIVITSQSGAFALGNTQNSNNRSATAVEKGVDTLTISEDVQIITLEAGVVENTFAFNVGTGYLYAPSLSSNHLKTHASIDENSSWLITFDEWNVASIVAQGGSEINRLLYNPTNKIFSCYASAQEPLMIYKLVEVEK